MKYLILILFAFVVGCGGNSNQPTFLDYSLMNKNSSAIIVDDKNNFHTQWKRTVTGPNSSFIDWIESKEFFYWDNDWIYLDKFVDNKTQKEYPQFVTWQEFCVKDVCKIISTEGKQKYAPMNVKDDYTLDTIGYILTPENTRIEFRHLQKIYIVPNCSTPYYKDQTCIIQNEKWWDDNLTEYSLKVYKNTWYALNLGIGFMIENKIPTRSILYMTND
jgi:hypothetical protein